MKLYVISKMIDTTSIEYDIHHMYVQCTYMKDNNKMMYEWKEFSNS